MTKKLIYYVKSREDCDKFSKIFGSRLSSRSKMTFLTLFFIAVLSFSLASELWAADCATGKKVCGTGCVDEAIACNSCGGNCYYIQVGGEVTLYGTGSVASEYKNWDTVNGVYGLYDSSNNPNPFYNNTSITSIKVDESSNLTSIGNWAFQNLSNLTSIYMPNITKIGVAAFLGATSLTDITISDSTTIGVNAFLNSSAFINANCIEQGNTPITCERLKGSMQYSGASFSDEESFQIITTLVENCSRYRDGMCVNCMSGKYWQEGKCVSSCGTNFRFNNGICWRVRYTPAEVAEVVGESNTIFLYYK